MKEHAIRDYIWYKNQIRTCEGVLGTIDRLLFDNCIVPEVRNHKRNLALAYYDYQKAYNNVNHHCITIVYRWMVFPKRVVQVIEQIMCRWKTRLEVTTEGKKETSRWINTKSEYLTSRVLSH